MSPTFRDFSGRHALEVEEFADPDSLSALRDDLLRAEAKGLSVHAMGSAWAFSAPAYCPGMVIRTERLNGFPAGVQRAITNPGGRILVAVEAGIKIRDLYLALGASPRVMHVTVAPTPQPYGKQVTLTVTVRDDTGAPIPGAKVIIQNFANRDADPTFLEFITDVTTGLASFPITFNEPWVVTDPVTHDRETVGMPSGEVRATGFGAATLPLDFGASSPTPRPLDPDDAPWRPPWALLLGRELTPPTLGGAGGQSLAGAVSTGTHGGDVKRPPIGDFVHAMVIVGSGGVIRLLQRDGNPPFVDFDLLKANLANAVDPTAILDATGTQTFDAAVVSVGRFGVVYAYVFEVHDESTEYVYERRSISSWETVKSTLAKDYVEAQEGDEFFQVVVNPVRPPGGDRRCYVTRHKKLPRTRIANAGEAFGLPADVASTEVARELEREPPLPDYPVEWRLVAPALSVLRQITEHFFGRRAPPGSRALCADYLTPELKAIQRQLREASAILAIVPGSAMLSAAADSIDRIGPDHNLGDVIAAALNAGPPGIVDQIIGGVVDVAQRPWLVHGRRWEIADTFDYENDCYRGDSVEIFFAADAELPGKVEEVFAVFDGLRAGGKPLAAYISLRFMAQSQSLLGMAFAPISCAIEVSMLRGLLANTQALQRLQNVATNFGGRIHWGQQNDLSAVAVARMYGDQYVRWCSSLQAVEGGSPTFSNPFTKSHGLEPRLTDARFVSQSVPALMTAGQTYPVSITMANTGTVLWTADAGYRLGSQNPPDNSIWGVGRVELPKPVRQGSSRPVRPGQEVTLDFKVTAPSAFGDYPFQWRMLQEMVEWFGEPTQGVVVTVSSECDRLRASISTSQARRDELIAERNALDPTDRIDRGEIERISADLTVLEADLVLLRQRFAALGCPP